MALKRTKAIEKKMSQLEDLKLYFEELASTKQEAHDNKSDKWQDSEVGEESQSNIEELERISEQINDAWETIDSLFEESN